MYGEENDYPVQLMLLTVYAENILNILVNIGYPVEIYNMWYRYGT